MKTNFTSQLNRAAWAIRKAAAQAMNVRVSDVSWKVCLEMARNNEEFSSQSYDLETFDFENTHAAGKFADGWKFRQATGMIDGDTITVKSVNFGYVRSGKMENCKATVKAHIAFEAAGYAKATSQSWGWRIPAEVKKIVGQTYGFGEIFKKKGFSWNADQKAWER